MDRRKRIRTAMGECEPDLVLKHGRIIQVLTGEIYPGDIAISDGYIAGIGEYSGKREMDLQGRFVSPGFINAHCHVESSMALPEIYCWEELRHGVTALITDPHEIANVAGEEGISMMLERSQNLPVHYFVQVPSCVPATPGEHNHGALKSEELSRFLHRERVTGLGEMMDFFGVVACRPDIMEKLELYKGKVIDGHLPSVPQNLLQPYAAAGIHTDHESVSFEEARQKLRAGIRILIREGSGSKNLEDIVSGIVREGLDTSNFAFCTDDKHLLDIRREGTIRCHIQRAIELGISPMAAYQMATINAARIYRLHDIGVIAPGYRADLVILDDMEKVSVHEVYAGGNRVEESNFRTLVLPVPENILHSVHIAPMKEEDFEPPKQDDYRVIHMVENQIVTKKKNFSGEQVKEGMKNGTLLKIAVIERHHATGNIGLGFLSNYGLRNGAIATTVAHDSHNLIVAGDSSRDMLLAAKELERVQGGYTLVREGRVVATLPLPVGGLMSLEKAEPLTDQIERLTSLAYEMGVNKAMDPFIALSFLALPVLPEIRITDNGLMET